MSQFVDYLKLLEIGDNIYETYNDYFRNIVAYVEIPNQIYDFGIYPNCPIGNLVRVPWAQFKITKVQYTADDLISFPFDGCYMASYVLGGNKYGFHIHISSSPANSRLENWNAHVDSVTTGVAAGGLTATQIKLYRPNRAFGNKLLTRLLSQNAASVLKVFGLITPNGCYTIYLEERRKPNNDKYYKFQGLIEERVLPQYKISSSHPVQNNPSKNRLFPISLRTIL